MVSSSHKHRPELHITAETGVLEAPAGALVVDGSMHVFHQFRPRAGEGSRWAHQVASDVAYDWDVCDDVLVPQQDTGQDTEIDILAGATVPVGGNAVELFFVTTSADGADSAEALGTAVDHGNRGPRSFTIQRAYVGDVSELIDVSDDPSEADPRVERLGPVTIEDSAFAVDNLVAPCVIKHEDDAFPDQPWLMLALALEGESDARIVVLRSADRQNWQVVGPLEVPAEAVRDSRPFAPRIVSMGDATTGTRHDVIFVTYPGAGEEATELTGYLVGSLSGSRFDVTTPFTPLDHGHDFTRPRIINRETPVMFGLVGSHPSLESTWANCLTAPRYLSLIDGVLYQDIIGAPMAVRSFSDYAFIWAAQLDAKQGEVTVQLTAESGSPIATVVYSADKVTVTRHPSGESRTATLQPAESEALTVFFDSPVCEVFANGGAATLTSMIPSESRVASIDVSTSGGAKVQASMQTAGQQLMRMQAGLTSPEEQERFQAEAILADRDVAEGVFEES
ncbi:MAG TPA: GH32 C-terminal domain-containing protein [Candidatus Corynebacterium gallistercoris]|uniref:beta-fructofuranosidase n=1 Tax=Candidatus Corynebacterium gallistercoris TaxID=2838530 RepID=A0A9D1S0F4_9CORY|nr:GH32 C-terminal domain-containing protein [Candidatus Corynebacterium gallistercoris]